MLRHTFVVLAVAACAAFAPAALPLYPERLELWEGTAGWGYFEVTSAGAGALDISEPDDEHVLRTRRVRPSDVAWRRFWQDLDEAHIAAWRESYVPREDHLDQTPWGIEIRRGNLVIRSSGYEIFPGYFPRYVAAVAALVGAPLFFAP